MPAVAGRLGVAGLADRVIVGADGSLRPESGGCTLRWYVLSDGTWSDPGAAAATRTGVAAAGAAVTIRIRVAAGDIEATTWVALDRGGVAHARLDLTNAGTRPVAVAVVMVGDLPDAVEPRRDDTDVIGLVAGAGTTVTFGRRPAAVLALNERAPVLDQLPSEIGEGDTDVPPGSVPAIAAVFPVAHATALEMSLSLGTDRSASPPDALADLDSVASGWAAHLDRGVRVDTGDDAVDDAVAQARLGLVMAVGDGSCPGDGGRADASLRRGVLSWAATCWGFDAEADSIRPFLDVDVEVGGPAAWVGWVLATVSAHRLAESAPPDDERLAMAVAALDAAVRRRHRWRRRPTLVVDDDAARRDDPALTLWAATALAAAADHLGRVGQPDAAARVDRLAAEVHRLWRGVVDADDRLHTVAAALGPWAVLADPPPAPVLSLDADDSIDLGVALVGFARRFVAERPDGLAVVAPADRRGNWEIHDLPTGFGAASVALRWHGDRPALLWEHTAPRLTAPGFDSTWSDDRPRGEALLRID